MFVSALTRASRLVCLFFSINAVKIRILNQINFRVGMTADRHGVVVVQGKGTMRTYWLVDRHATSSPSDGQSTGHG